ncbi:MAG: MFS transporter [Chloroflexota bacterium]|nr:MFS transporter [Chloroflexota bacterium]
MGTQITEAEKIRRLPWLVGGDAFNIMFVLLTFSGSVFVLFLDELGLNSSQIGILLALVPFCGIIAPLVAPITTRVGYKRIFLSMRFFRIFPIALLLFTPIVLRDYGDEMAFRWVAGIILAFAILRAIGETGGFPWRKEIVPDSIRGKFSAITSMVTTVASIIIVLLAGYVIDSSVGLGRFMVLIAIGLVLGLISVFFFARSPGDDRSQAKDTSHLAGVRDAIRNRAFLMFLLVLALATIGGQAVRSFIPLFMKDEVGLSQGIVVLLSIGTFMGALVTSYFWGWAADRYSSRPVMQASLILLILLPVFWLMLPRFDPASVALAMAIAFLAGIATLAWQISWTRYLFVNAIPSENRSAYLAVYFAWLSLVVGAGPLLAGQLLSFSAQIPQRQIGLIYIDPYTPLFLISIVLLALALIFVPRLKAESNLSFRRFAGMFLRGNPVRAMRLLIQYNQSGDEMTRVLTAERMGDTGNLLTSDELIDALTDPSYSVRYEAVHSIGRMPGTPELREALVEILEGPQDELGMTTARALGRLGDPDAIPALRRSLYSRYDLVATESARALAQLGDSGSIPDLIEKLRAQSSSELQVAYASALGKLRAREAIPDIFQLLCGARTRTGRGELGLAIARMVGDEKYYLQHWRSLYDNFDTAAAQALLALRKPARRAGFFAVEPIIERCSDHFAAGRSEQGTQDLQELLRTVAASEVDETQGELLSLIADSLDQCGGDRIDLVLLSLHALDCAFGEQTE